MKSTEKIGKNYVRNIRNSISLLVLFLVAGCQYFNFNKDVDKTPIAQVYDKYLYFEDINPKIFRDKSPEDSLAVLREYIEDWAYKTLLLKQAQNNVDTLKINRLVNQYKNDLLIDTYKDLLIQKYIDTVVLPDTLQAYYQKYKNYFKAKKAMVYPVYAVVKRAEPKAMKIKKWFFSDKTEWQDSLFKNTGIIEKMNLTGRWMQIDSLKRELPAFQSMNDKYILKKSKKFVITDSLSLYLVLVKDVVQPGEALPPDFVRDDLRQLVLSKRKQAGWSKIENDIKQEAIKQKHFKIIKNKSKK